MKHTADKDYNYSTDRTPAGNSGFKKLAVQWLIEHSTSHQHLWWLDSFVLRNRQLLKPANRQVVKKLRFSQPIAPVERHIKS